MGAWICASYTITAEVSTVDMVVEMSVLGTCLMVCCRHIHTEGFDCLAIWLRYKRL